MFCHSHSIIESIDKDLPSRRQENVLVSSISLLASIGPMFPPVQLSPVLPVPVDIRVIVVVVGITPDPALSSAFTT